MKYREILVIRQVLDMLAQDSMPAAFELAKNIRICDKIIKDGNELSSTLYDKYADRDDKGEIKVYEDNGKQVKKITNKTKETEFSAEYEKLLNDEHEVTFSKISSAKLADTKLKPMLLVPLLDVILID